MYKSSIEIQGNIAKPMLPAVLSQERKVALCWATKKRHIALDGEVDRKSVV